MPYLKNIQSLTLTINLPLTQERLILLPNEISRAITDEESLQVEVQRAVKNRSAVLLSTLDTANVCSKMVYKGFAGTEPFPEDPQRGWVVVADINTTTPTGDSIEAGWVAMYTGTKWHVYCGV